ncbi:MAG: hypothetical protein KAH86_00110 [Methanosarcinales archaeon]|nr:hypothetical protein [Methanosarcinales archaeon]
MGFETSATVLILLGGFIVLSSATYSTLEYSIQSVDDARSLRDERMFDNLNTKMVITNITDAGVLVAYNNGTTTLDATKINVIINGTLMVPSTMPTTVAWVSRGNIVIIDNTYINPNSNVLIVSENGVTSWDEH